MRKRFGAIHSDTVDDFIEAALKAENKEGVYYSGVIQCPKQKNNERSSFDNFDFKHSQASTRQNSSDALEDLLEEDVLFTVVKKVSIFEEQVTNLRKRIYEHCGLEYTEGSYSFDYLSKSEEDLSEQLTTTKFWINNLQSSAPKQIVDEYIKSSPSIIYISMKKDKMPKQTFLRRVQTLKNDDHIIHQIQIDLPNHQHKITSYITRSNFVTKMRGMWQPGVEINIQQISDLVY